MNGTTNDAYMMQDPYVQGANDLWSSAPTGSTGPTNSTYPMQQQNNTQMQAQPPAQTPNMRHGLSSDVIGSPISVEEAYQGSLRGMLGREIGAYIAATFLVGTEELVRWAGRLYEVGNNYIVIYQQDQGRYVVGDLNSLRFVEFSESGSRAPIATRPCNNGPAAW